MNLIAPIIALCLPIAGACSAQGGEGPAPKPEVARISDELGAKTKFLNPEYLVFAPELKDEKEQVPLLIYLHGGGGVGREILKVKGQPGGVFRAIGKHGHGPCVVVAPQCRREGEGGGWIAEELNLLLQHLKTTLPVDAKRIYLTGNSMGGYGSWMWAGQNPEHFAAIAPVVGGIGPGGPKDVSPEIESWAEKLATIPLWAFAGGRDRVVPAERSERMVDLIKKAGGEAAKITVFKEAGHSAGREVFDNPQFYSWLFEQSR